MTIKRKLQIARELAEATAEDRADVLELLKDKLPKPVKKQRRARKAKKQEEGKDESKTGDVGDLAGEAKDQEPAKPPVRRRGPNKPKVAAATETTTAPSEVESGAGEVAGESESDEDIVKRVLEGGL